MKKLVIISLLVVSIVTYWIINNRLGVSKSSVILVEQNKAVPTITITPSATPLPINKDTNLENALDSLAPSDFSSEYPKLTEK
ncbi:hypothetical protein A3H85_02810 [Candidatus Daviesbacteria bacterium RIFCSPLOWO2_02_FULL_40_8]|uniref:Uncharacterized protein n=1 Tax=Candidatus Daviesbacteria bacterium RIFCSPLOWO2_01_FULL_40_24 TaxID=1797787 RepID=A0A1F5MIZ5_9BACT|nr:MAG: hypothetical protein A2780_01470 [Candidatus Daviesbacteria bacterium RIFCSPHIGHO2_01_FULL_41_45]OGE34918.1 MAG: hypothetical protein A3C32_02795 [Candidatus Daviesbacteria bacterium RIFCSPHIGHO2_02_FULL_41_14]OGE65325.1 MAG: hypothetical protein A3B49_03510 [Candidatus Daviesbacteria bacterium RIFCSPLOWO2_01_FULL_40_24]OGE67122.1 MAG: hypothetical protein A3H85_02810 [Candidatus Daviesbacteria bacterium RIFCSPLOWO2_02_FULL_40_8]